MGNKPNPLQGATVLYNVDPERGVYWPAIIWQIVDPDTLRARLFLLTGEEYGGKYYDADHGTEADQWQERTA